jgi:hypothetical protein
MKRYYIGKDEITEAEAKAIETKNRACFDQAEKGNFAALMEVRYIVTVEA